MKRILAGLLLVLLIMISLVGCIHDEKNNEINSGTTHEAFNLDDDKTLTYPDMETTQSIEDSLDRIRLGIMEEEDYDQIETIKLDVDDYYLAIAKKETFADVYYMCDLVSNSLHILPTGGQKVLSYEVYDEDHIRLYMSGEHSEVSDRAIPFIYDFIKDNHNNYLAIKKEKYFKLNESFSFGGKPNQQLEDVNLTLKGLELAFGPEYVDDPNYYAGSVQPPISQVTFDESKHQLNLKFEDTVLSGAFRNDQVFLDDEHGYIDSIQVTAKQDALLLIVQLKEYDDQRKIKFYTSEIVRSLSAHIGMSFDFYYELPLDY